MAFLTANVSTSPTVYVVYDLITADAFYYGGEPDVVTVGPSLSLFTQALAQDVLLTPRCPYPQTVSVDDWTVVVWHYDWETIDYRDFNTPVPWSVVSKQYDCRSNGAKDFNGEDIYHDPSEFVQDYTVEPYIVYPDDHPDNIVHYFPEWSTCTWGPWPAFDPPYALTRAVMPPQNIPATQPDTQPTSPPIIPPASPPGGGGHSSGSPPGGSFEEDPHPGGDKGDPGNSNSNGNGNGNGNPRVGGGGPGGGTDTSGSNGGDPKHVNLDTNPPKMSHSQGFHSGFDSSSGHGSHDHFAGEGGAPKPDDPIPGSGSHDGDRPGIELGHGAGDSSNFASNSQNGQDNRPDDPRRPRPGNIAGWPGNSADRAGTSSGGEYYDEGHGSNGEGGGEPGSSGSETKEMQWPSVGPLQIRPAPNGGAYLGSIRLPPKVKAILVGTPVSVGDNFIVVGTSTFDLASPPTPFPRIAGNMPSFVRNGDLTLGTITLHPGGKATTISGTVVSVLSSNGGILIDGSVYAPPHWSLRPTSITFHDPESLNSASDTAAVSSFASQILAALGMTSDSSKSTISRKAEVADTVSTLRGQSSSEPSLPKSTTSNSRGCSVRATQCLAISLITLCWTLVVAS